MPFEPNKIAIAMMKAFLAVHGTQGAASASVRETVDALTQAVIRALVRSRPGGGTFHIEDVQDQVELGLMRGGHHEIARAYVLYRERRTQERAKQSAQQAPKAPALHVLDGGQRVALDLDNLKGLIESACEGLGGDVKSDPIVAETMRNLYDGVPHGRGLQGVDPGGPHADREGSRLHLCHGPPAAAHDLQGSARPRPAAVRNGAQLCRLLSRLRQEGRQTTSCWTRSCCSTTWKSWARALKAERDLKFDYLGLQTLYDRYFLHVRKTRIELPQAFFMRVAMGLA